jgi:hypothetical protein
MRSKSFDYVYCRDNRYTQNLLSSDVPEFPRHQFSSVRDLCFTAMRNFSPALLSCAWIGTGAADGGTIQTRSFSCLLLLARQHIPYR